MRFNWNNEMLIWGPPMATIQFRMLFISKHIHFIHTKPIASVFSYPYLHVQANLIFHSYVLVSAFSVTAITPIYRGCFSNLWKAQS